MVCNPEDLRKYAVGTERGNHWPLAIRRQKAGWNPNIAPLEPIYEARKGEKASQVGELNLDIRRNMEAEITNRAVEFIKRNASAHKPLCLCFIVDGSYAQIAKRRVCRKDGKR